jgi:hypothetical protein
MTNSAPDPTPVGRSVCKRGVLGVWMLLVGAVAFHTGPRGKGWRPRVPTRAGPRKPLSKVYSPGAVQGFQWGFAKHLLLRPFRSPHGTGRPAERDTAYTLILCSSESGPHLSPSPHLTLSPPLPQPTFRSSFLHDPSVFYTGPHRWPRTGCKSRRRSRRRRTECDGRDAGSWVLPRPAPCLTPAAPQGLVERLVMVPGGERDDDRPRIRPIGIDVRSWSREYDSNSHRSERRPRTGIVTHRFLGRPVVVRYSAG